MGSDAAEASVAVHGASKRKTTSLLWSTTMRLMINYLGFTPRQLFSQIASVGMVVASALIIWKTLCVFSYSESPIVVVLSESMSPGFERGDILLLHMETGALSNGDIVVFNIDGRNIPIVHRIIRTHDLSHLPRNNMTTFESISDDGKLLDEYGSPLQELLTKGDNNMRDDRSLYATGQDWLYRDHVIGRAFGYIPYVGMATIIMNDYPWLKFVILGALSIIVLFTRE